MIKEMAIAKKSAGFTLIELIVAMTIAGILATVSARLISRPVEAYISLKNRVQLVDTADHALERITREIQSSLPNSIRIGCSGECVELLKIIDGGRYRAIAPGDQLSFNPGSADSSFEVLGNLTNLSKITFGVSADDCQKSLAACAVVYNTGETGHNAYALDNVATVTNITGTPSVISFDNTQFSSGETAFPDASPSQRFQIIDTPVTYICDKTNNTLRRYEGYAITSDQTAVDTHAELIALSNIRHALVADKISDCKFEYDNGSATRDSLLTIRLTLTETLPSGHTESITLLQQAHASNIP